MADKLTLREATAEVLRRSGPDILAHPKRFMGAIQDFIDNDTLESAVMYRAGDEDLLGRFADACGKGVTSLRAAGIAARCYLHEQCGYDEALCNRVAWGIALGIADFDGVAEELATDPTLPDLDAEGQTGSSHGRAFGGEDHTLVVGEDGVLGGTWDNPSVDGLRMGSARRSNNVSASAGSAVLRGRGATGRGPATSPLGSSSGSLRSRSQGARGSRSTATAVPLPRTPLWPKLLLAASLVVLAGTVVYVLLVRGNSGQVFGNLRGSAAREATVSFDANGADASVDALTVAAGESIALPQGSDFTRTGYTFAGWATDRAAEASAVYKEGADFKPDGDTVLFAQWELDGTPSFSEVSTRSEILDDGSECYFVEVKNDSEATVDLEATFSFCDADDTEVDSASAVKDAYSVGPGDTVLFWASSDAEGVERGKCTFEPKPTAYSPYAISAYAEVSCTKEGKEATVNVKNGSERTLTLKEIVVFAQQDGNLVLSPLDVPEDDERHYVEPGETVSFSLSDSQGILSKVDSCEAFFYGYAR